MQSTRSRTVLAISFIALLFVSSSARTLAFGSASQGGNVLHFTASVHGVNPCTGEAVSGSLKVLLVVSRISTGNGQVHVNIHGSFHGQLTGNLGTVYQVSAEGHGEADAASNFYDFAFSVEAISHGAAPNLTLDGVARVFVNNDGDPVGATIVSLTPNCI